ncbi:hypothetical protein RM780_09695 [Streptomyces sp. DSM 44917]|uniref:Uncharacterized protein n=1 Tax=Streptomyces boetiae TaxID=3075541 RepID=A0ABU2L6P4_9ACTN|nr:hypothetical protein [Streptomyces sp. DSM 44917]MDT0307235.1 hypothetical protein [Streptomyces sp. DSM 44917]
MRVEWFANPSALPGLGRLVRKAACGQHLAQLARQGLRDHPRHVHILPIDTATRWWRT